MKNEGYKSTSYKSQGSTLDMIITVDEIMDMPDRLTMVNVIKGRSTAPVCEGPIDQEKMESIMKELRTLTPKYEWKAPDGLAVQESMKQWYEFEEAMKDDALSSARAHRHQMIYKLSDIIDDSEYEIARMMRNLTTYRKSLGLGLSEAMPCPYVYIDTHETAATYSPEAIIENMKTVQHICKMYQTALCVSSNKSDLKSALYAFMYSSTPYDALKDKDVVMMSFLNKPDKDKFLNGHWDTPPAEKRAVLHGSGSPRTGLGLSCAALANAVKSVDMDWFAEEMPSIPRADVLRENWNGVKLRRGKGHNKFGRKGKK